MLLRHISNALRSVRNSPQFVCRLVSSSCLGFEHKELTTDLKHRIEAHWRHNLGDSTYNAQSSDARPRKYILSMFPYPSGNLHMGHVRVYTISDAMARFYRMRGCNVLHPMGWDAFGLPAENAAIERRIGAQQWTERNIAEMRAQFDRLGCSFDWTRELATCRPDYYRWTQWLFVRMFRAGLAYRREALVNWDPVDRTVLADEQVDANGCSWRSGACVQKKLLNQWFVRTTRFARPLLDGLNDPALEDWRDIVKLQRHWIGTCDGFGFEMPLQYADESADGSIRLRSLKVWTRTPEDLRSRAAFVAVREDHVLRRLCAVRADGTANVWLRNPFDGDRLLPVLVVPGDAVAFEEGCDVHLVVPSRSDADRALAERHGWSLGNVTASTETDDRVREAVLAEAQRANIGGWPVSSKLQDWSISRQRAWGTPIPIVHCARCGAVPVPDEQLPVRLAEHRDADDSTSTTPVKCPQCGSTEAHRETDTMDTFVDSSWYFLRYTDARNSGEPFERTCAGRLTPVDLYVGGKEHAVLHLYYARFVSHFLHSIGRLPQPEPFRRLLVQGMVMGRSFRVAKTGQYVRPEEVRVTDEKRQQAELIETGEAVRMQWEKMSKSKRNGAEPSAAIDEHGTDAIRLIMLGDVAPTSHRNWSEATFPGILKWQHRLWLTMQQFHEIRSTADRTLTDEQIAVIRGTTEFVAEEERLNDARNYFLKEATFNYQFSHQLSVAISKMQGLTNAIRRTPADCIRYGRQYEHAVATLLQMLAPMAPHFASELWAQFCELPMRANATNLADLRWDEDVLAQRWPQLDANYRLDLVYKVNGQDLAVGKFTAAELRELTADDALRAALGDPIIASYVDGYRITNTAYVHYPECEARVSIAINRHHEKPATKKKAGKTKARSAAKV